MLTNLYWLCPEINLSIGLVLLLVFNTIYVKLNNEYAQHIKFIWLSIFLLLITSYMYLDQLFLTQPVVISLSLLNSSPLCVFIKLIVCTSTVVLLLWSKDIWILKQIKHFEYFNLLLLALLGMLLLLSSNDLIIFYLNIELLSLSLYILAAINKQSEHSTEAGLKYFILGSLSSGLLLFGCAILYIFTGETNFDSISYLIWYNQENFELILGTMFIFIAILFKLAAAPFHMWLPDVYEGAPTIITAFFAIVPKIATLGIFINLIWCWFGLFQQIQPILIVSTILSMLIGSIGALNQTKIKRLIAYSAISHIGFILLGLLPGTLYGLQATLMYIIIYITMSIASFSFILVFFKKTNYISELSGLSRKNPILASTFAIILFSIAGLPPLAGFFSKYLILLEALSNELILLAIIGVAASCIAAFYYIQIIKWMFFKDSADYYFKDIADILKHQNNISLSHSLVLGVTLFIVITLLFYPNYLMNLTLNLLIVAQA